MGKPVALISASAHGQHARASLFETLSVMMAELIEAASITLALPSNAMTAQQIEASPGHADAIRRAIETLGDAVKRRAEALASAPRDDFAAPGSTA